LLFVGALTGAYLTIGSIIGCNKDARRRKEEVLYLYCSNNRDDNCSGGVYLSPRKPTNKEDVMLFTFSKYNPIKGEIISLFQFEKKNN
jgi:hypothetical protein